MSDLSDLHGIYPVGLRMNAETGVLSVSTYDAETGGREQREIELGKAATFVLDMATRERGYGLIKIATYNMILTPVGSPAPAWPGDDEYKPALGCWLWNPTFGEVRVETNASIFRTAISDVWDRARREPQFMEGLQPVIRFVGRAEIEIKSVGKTFFGPVIDIIGWTERDKVPGWKERAPTVPLPPASPLLAASSAPATATPAAKTLPKSKAKIKDKQGPKPGPDDPGHIDPNLNDPLPW